MIKLVPKFKIMMNRTFPCKDFQEQSYLGFFILLT